MSREAVEQLMSLVEAAPDTPFSLSLQDRSLSADDLRVEIGVDNSVRDALLNGTWDATGMLLDDFDVVRGVAERVPYIRGF